MSVSFLPKTFDPRRLAESRTCLSGEFRVEQFDRLVAHKVSACSDVAIQIDFLIDEAGRVMLNGHLKTDVTLQCQRCLDDMAYHIETDFTLAAVTTEQAAKRLPDDLDALVTHGEPVSLSQLIEDEILLNLPLVAKHDSDSCETYVQVEPEEFQVSPEKKNPFQVLEKLLEETKVN